MHDLALEDLHLVDEAVEFDFILDSNLFLQIKVVDISWYSHAHPIVLLLNHVVDTFDSHEESEHGIVID